MTSTRSTDGESGSSGRAVSRAWTTGLRVFFKTTPTPVMRLLRRTRPSVPIEELIVVGRRSGRERRLLVVLYDVDGRWYIGHPNGSSQWVRNLAAAGSGVVVQRGDRRTTVNAIELSDGAERDAVIQATSYQPFPAGLVYRAARRHILAAGRYFRLEPAPDGEA